MFGSVAIGNFTQTVLIVRSVLRARARTDGENGENGESRSIRARTVNGRRGEGKREKVVLT